MLGLLRNSEYQLVDKITLARRPNPKKCSLYICSFTKSLCCDRHRHIRIFVHSKLDKNCNNCYACFLHFQKIEISYFSCVFEWSLLKTKLQISKQKLVKLEAFIVCFFVYVWFWRRIIGCIIEKLNQTIMKLIDSISKS